jgi:hypothetical protein
VIQAGGLSAPRLRALPIAYHPASPTDAFGRVEELALTRSATPESPVQLYGPDGIGKTTLLKLAAERASPPPEGVAFESGRRRNLDEVQLKLYTVFWESDTPFLPDPAQVEGFLIDREALVLLDDCQLDREDLDALLESAPRCSFVIGSEARALWSRGTARALGGLDPPAGVALLERELGEAVEKGQREDAETIVERLEGRPQSLVETAALIEEGGASLHELAHDPKALEGRIDPETLTASQRRILGLLGALEGAALGVEHVAVLADEPQAASALAQLERHGWVKSHSPRYRLVRDLPEGFVMAAEWGFPNRLLDHLALWARGEENPAAIAAEGDAIEAALALGAKAGRWQETLSLALAAGTKLALAGAWATARRVLSSGLAAARALNGEPAEAYFLHQLGSFAICLGESEAAVSELSSALQIRQRLGDGEGAELTRHNLGQIGGPGPDGGGGNGGGGPWRPRLGMTLAVIAAIGAIIVGAVALAGNGGGGAGKRAGETSTDRSPGGGAAKRPGEASTDRSPGGVANGERNAGGGRNDRNPTSLTLTIYSPRRDPPYDVGETVVAEFSCIYQADGSQAARCVGTLDGASTIHNGDPIGPLRAGTHTFIVTATDRAGKPHMATATFRVGRTTDGTSDGTSDGVQNGTSDGVYNGTYDGTYDGTGGVETDGVTTSP